MTKKWFFFCLPLLLLLTACGISLASDITPPPNYKSPVPPKAASTAATAPVSPAAAAQPLLPPDPVQGAAYYADKCLPCHGPTGRGDGPQAAKLGLPVPAIGTVELARKAKPAVWYDLVTNGRMDKGMPPFRSLNDRQRWDVIAYVETLSAPQTSVQQGQTLYTEKCAGCHGVSGKGDGAEAKTRVPDWTDPARLSQRSIDDLVNVINSGVGSSMPAYASQYSEDQRWALANYVRTLSFAVPGSSQVASVATSAPTPVGGTPQSTAATPAAQITVAPFTVIVAGKINPVGSATVPAGLKVTLQAYDNMAPTWSAVTDVKADGTYRFENVEVISGRAFIVGTDYQGVSYQSDPLHAADMKAGQESSVAISLAEVTNDAKTLSVQRMHIFFDFSQAGSVQVAELFIVNNAGDKAVAPASKDKPVLLFELPTGATELSFQEGEMGVRYVQTDKGFGDLSPIMPNGQLQVLFGYLLPYTGKGTISIPVTLPVESSVLMVPSGGVTVESTLLRSAGERDVNGANIQLFTANSLPANSKLDVTLSGVPSAGNLPGGATPATTTNPRELVIGIGVFGVVLLLAGVWLFRQRRRTPVEESDEEAAELAEEESVEAEDPIDDTPEALLDAIVTLDDLYQAGQLPEVAYQQRRADLKARLKAVRGK